MPKHTMQVAKADSGKLCGWGNIIIELLWPW